MDAGRMQAPLGARPAIRWRVFHCHVGLPEGGVMYDVRVHRCRSSKLKPSASSVKVIRLFCYNVFNKIIQDQNTAAVHTADSPSMQKSGQKHVIHVHAVLSE